MGISGKLMAAVELVANFPNKSLLELHRFNF